MHLTELDLVTRELRTALKKIKNDTIIMDNAKTQFDESSKNYRDILERRIKLVKTDTGIVTLWTIFEQIGKPFVLEVDGCTVLEPFTIFGVNILIVSPRTTRENLYNYLKLSLAPGTVREYTNLDHAIIMPHARLVAIWKIQWWFTKNHGRILAWLYRPGGPMERKGKKRFEASLVK